MYNQAVQSHWVNHSVFYDTERKIIVRGVSFEGNVKYKEDMISEDIIIKP